DRLHHLRRSLHQARGAGADQRVGGRRQSGALAGGEDQALRPFAQRARPPGRRGHRHPEGQAPGGRDPVRRPHRGALPVTAVLLAEITSTDLLRTLVSGVALGSKYALVALGFVVVFKSTGVLNFAQASFVLLGGYVTYTASNFWGLNFYL